MGKLKELQSQGAATDSPNFAGEPDDFGLDPELEQAVPSENVQVKAADAPPAPEAPATAALVVEPALSGSLYVLRELLQAHQWEHHQSDEPGLKSNADLALSMIETKMAMEISAGNERQVMDIWRTSGAPGGHPGFVRAMQRSMMGNVTADAAPQAAPAAPVPDAPDAQQAQQKEPTPPAPAGTGSALGALLAAPFTLSAAAGSVVMSGLRAANTQAKSFYAQHRINGHAVLGRQLDERAEHIAALAESLNKQGMGTVIERMRASNIPASKLMDSMKPGGANAEAAGLFETLMGNRQFANNLNSLRAAIGEFGDKATRYAKTGVELNLDHSDAIDRNLDKITAVTDGFIFKEDGAIKQLQELASKIAERVRNLVDRVLGRLSPAA